jgi:glycosyltransferase involved in cell wall biosynthesis
VDGAQVKVAVYQRYWSTMGGGEQYAGGIAQVLSEDHDVDLLGPAPVDIGALHERLGLDLSRTALRLTISDSDVASASADYDLFVNCTYLSPVRGHAGHNLYVVHFPGTVPPRRERRLDAARNLVVRVTGRPIVHLGTGIRPDDGAGAGRWTDGFGELAVVGRPGATIALTVSGGEPGPRPLRVTRDRQVVCDGTIRDEIVHIDAGTIGESGRAELVVESGQWHARGDDRRRGVLLTALTVDGVPVDLAPDRFRRRLQPADRYGFLTSYDRVVANSSFTRQWIHRLWGIDADVLYPPVVMRPSSKQKAKRILSIGRFFASEYGHSKRQLEMVQAFGALHRQGVAKEWELHLVGGCDAQNRAYATEVRRAAQGLPVSIWFNATGAELAELLDTSAIYWHAGGLGQDPQRYPDRFEHFGIAVVEAMSAGLVPVVFGAAGPAEIVRDRVDGRWFRDPQELVDVTAELVANDTERARLASAATRRAADFALPAFRRRLHDVLTGLPLGSPS